jgi:hypothetical protein
MSVNRPTDVKVKEADVNRKLQLYGIVSAFQAGKVPSNEQIDIALNSFLASQAIASPSKKLSKEGQALVAEFRDVVEQAKYLLLSKNEGNLLQDFIWQSQHIDAANAALPGAPIDKDTAKQHGNQALEGLRTLGTLIISNGQFRKLLNDATILIRDMAGDAATKAANKVNPSEDQLAQIDRPADDNVWHDVPDMSAGNLKQQVKETYNKNAPLSKKDLKDATGDASQSAHPDGSRDPTQTADLAARDQQSGTASGLDAQGGAQSGLNTLQRRLSDNVSEDTKNRGRQTKETALNYLTSKLPEERREQTIYRLKKMIVEIQSHPDYQQAITTLLDLAEEYASHANTIGQQSTGAVKGAHADTSLKRAEQDLKTLIERFANGTSTNDLFDAINQVYSDADKDPELKSWFKQIDTYIRKALKQQGYIMEDAASEEWDRLYDRGNFLLRDRYRNHTDRILDEFTFLGKQFDEDPLNRKFGKSVNKLFTDLGNDENGKPTFKPHLVKDLADVILPGIFESIRYVPIPRIEFSDPMIDAVIENLVIESDNLMPNILEVANDNYFRWGRKNVANKNVNSVTLSVSGIQMDLRDVSYYIKKKTGFPSITDMGVLDIFLGGTGFSFKMKLSTAEKKDRQNFFKVDKVDVDVRNFNIRIKQSKHKLLFTLAKSIMIKTMRPAIQKALEKVIKDKAHELDSLAYEVKIEADRAQEQIKQNPEQVQNIYQRYVNAAQKKVLQGKKKTEEIAATTKVNMAITKQDSLFPDIHLPGGISSKATEYKELANKGNDWQSSVFKLGTASPTKNLPAAPNVTRKHHTVTQGGVRGPQNVGNTNSMNNQLRDPAAQRQGGLAHSDGDSGYTNGSANGFGKQVDQALNGNTTYPSNGGVTGNGNGNGLHNANGVQNEKWNTTLGSNNPVVTGNI